MTFEQGSVVLVPFPFTDLSTAKQRPALVLRSDALDPDLVVCAITSQLSGSVVESEFVIPGGDLVACGLPKASKIKLAKLFTLHPSLVRKKIGALPAAALTPVLAKARALFNVE
jgi:mRNA interferase MazF